MQTIAAIDVGSNAIRMVVGRVNHTEEVEAIDNIRLIRYHRKTASTNQDEQFKALAQKDRLIVTKLCALVRLADALEVSHTARIRDLTMKKAKGCWQLKMVNAIGDFGVNYFQNEGVGNSNKVESELYNQKFRV